MGDGSQEPAHAGFPPENVVERWQGEINGGRVVVSLSTRERDVFPGRKTFDTIAAFMPGKGGQGVKTQFLPPQRSYEDAMRHGRTCLLILGFVPI